MIFQAVIWQYASNAGGMNLQAMTIYLSQFYKNAIALTTSLIMQSRLSLHGIPKPKVVHIYILLVRTNQSRLSISQVQIMYTLIVACHMPTAAAKFISQVKSHLHDSSFYTGSIIMHHLYDK